MIYTAAIVEKPAINPLRSVGGIESIDCNGFSEWEEYNLGDYCSACHSFGMVPNSIDSAMVCINCGFID